MHHNLADIYLIRHGEPDVDWTQKIDANGFATWTRAYDKASLLADSVPSDDIRSLTKNAAKLFCSDLFRSSQSCLLSANAEPDAECSSLFNEVRLVIPPLGAFRFRPGHWVSLAGLFWRLGYARGVETRSAVRARAKAAVDVLISTALQNGAPVVLFGHGAMNKFLRRELASRGWTQAASSREGHYWGWTRHVARSGDRI